MQGLFGSEDDGLGVTKRISVISFPQDEEVVRSLSPTQRAEMAMTGQVSENLYTNLEHDFWLARWRAVQVLREVSPKNDERAVSLLIERTRDVMLEVVVGALDSLKEICERGHRVCRVVVENVLPLLEHEGSMVSTRLLLFRALLLRLAHITLENDAHLRPTRPLIIVPFAGAACSRQLPEQLRQSLG